MIFSYFPEKLHGVHHLRPSPLPSERAFYDCLQHPSSWETLAESTADGIRVRLLKSLLNSCALQQDLPLLAWICESIWVYTYEDHDSFVSFSWGQPSSPSPVWNPLSPSYSGAPSLIAMAFDHLPWVQYLSSHPHLDPSNRSVRDGLGGIGWASSLNKDPHLLSFCIQLKADDCLAWLHQRSLFTLEQWREPPLGFSFIRQLIRSNHPPFLDWFFNDTAFNFSTLPSNPFPDLTDDQALASVYTQFQQRLAIRKEHDFLQQVVEFGDHFSRSFHDSLLSQLPVGTLSSSHSSASPSPTPSRSSLRL